MKLKYFGTAAYEAFPALGCTCDTCKRARAAGGRNIRTRAQALLNDELLFDFPPDTVWHFMQYAIDFEKIKACLVSHSHSDHLYPSDIKALGAGYTKSDRTEPLHFFCGRSGYDTIKEETDAEHMRSRADVALATAFEKFSAAGYGILPVEADHAPDTTPLNYRVEKGGKSLLFAHDTGEYSKESLSALEKAGRLDLISLDCTSALQSGWRRGHLSFDTCLETIENLKKRGIADDRTLFVINHFSHNGGATYDDMVSVAKDGGVIVAYDGMEIEF